MENAALSFEQILNATVRMIRTTWKVPMCFFMQMDDQSTLRVRAADGSTVADVDKMVFKTSEGLVGRCVTQNALVETDNLSKTDSLFPLLNASLSGSN